jgi:Glycosyltransferase family 28 C-terminal domain
MSRVLTVWELGANLGHIDRMLLSAQALRARGHEVRFLLKDVSRAHARVAAQGFAMGQAPVWLPRLANPPPLGNYTAVLLGAGWMDPQGLAGLIVAWRDAFALARPDVLLCDHAPTAILAARGSGLPVFNIGNSFAVPPPGLHFPPMRIDPGAAELARCASDDEKILGLANRALALLGETPLARLTDLFAPVRRALATLPELAHYGQTAYTAGVDWVGPSYAGTSGVAPAWPAGSGPRVFAYLSPGYADFNPLMAALKSLAEPGKLGLVGLVHAKGLAPQAARLLGGERLRLEPEPVQMDPVMRDADLVISHASMGTVTAAALAGKPQLVLPTHAEQDMVAQRVAQAGLGLTVPVGRTGNAFEALLRKLLTEPDYARAAQALAARHAGATPAATGERLADLIEASLRPA